MSTLRSEARRTSELAARRGDIDLIPFPAAKARAGRLKRERESAQAETLGRMIRTLRGTADGLKRNPAQRDAAYTLYEVADAWESILGRLGELDW